MGLLRRARRVPRAADADVFQGTYEELRSSQDPVVRDFVGRAPLTEPRRESGEILRSLVGE